VLSQINITQEEQKVIDENVARLKEGIEVWNSWRETNCEIPIDLRKVNLRGEILSGANLNMTDLGGANLNGANLNGANLHDALLLEANLGGANLSGARLTCAQFNGAFLFRANLSGANLRCANFTDSNISAIKWDSRKMHGKYMGIRGIDSSYGNAFFKRAAADQDYLDTLEYHWKGKWQIYLFKLWGLIDYGRSIERVVAIAFGTMILFGLTYSVFPGLLGLDCLSGAKDCKRNSWFTPFYFSIVTFTTLGFGDITPKNLVGELIVSFEVIFGYAVLGLLISVLADKVVRRS
jgi:Ion channel/Pentapeptide repeats (8 copies)